MKNYKYNIFINQRAVIECGLTLDLIDMAIFDFIKDFANSPKCIKIQTDEGLYFWISHKVILDALPMLNIKSAQGIINRIDKLISASLLVKYAHCDKVGKTLYSFGQNYDKLLFFDTPQEILIPPSTELDTPQQKLIPPSTKVDAIINNKYNNIENNCTKVQSKRNEIPQKKELIEDGIPEMEVEEVDSGCHVISAGADLFEKFWNEYDKKVGREQALKMWSKLTQAEQKEAIQYIEGYKKAQPDKQYRKNPSTYLNQKSWRDELIYDKGRSQVNLLDDPEYQKQRSLEIRELARMRRGEIPMTDHMPF